MHRKAAKELMHIRAWLDLVAELVARGEEAYLDDGLLQEAGDSLMMKVGEAATRLSRLDVLAPDGVAWSLAIANRNFLIHQYDEVDRSLTWVTLSVDLSAWQESLRSLFADAERTLRVESDSASGLA